MPNFVLSCDDGAASDVRVSELATKYGYECTFYIPVDWHSIAHAKGYEPLNLKDARDIALKHRIGSHTITHRHLTDLPIDEAKYEISASRSMLEWLLVCNITKFCPPRGYTNQELTDFTLQYYASQRLTKGAGLVHVHPNSGANNNMHWLDYVKTIGIENVKEVWGHSHEFDKYNLWDELEEFLHANSSR